MHPSLTGLSPSALLSLGSIAILVPIVLFEWRTGRWAGGRKTLADWRMLGLSAGGIALLERPLQVTVVYAACHFIMPNGGGSLAAWAQDHFAISVLVYLAIDELIHGAMHLWTHRRPPANKMLARLHAFYRRAHRAHHLVGGLDDRGEVTATHAVVAGFGWNLGLPNYWLGFVALYAGLADTWLVANLAKNAWGIHVHANWSYDVALLNHRNRFVSGTMRALCHVLTFPNQHHHHHARGRHSAKNMQNVFALYDWLLWGTLVIPSERPKTYGWRQKPADQRVLHRYLGARPRARAER